jgi:hypothetical protein
MHAFTLCAIIPPHASKWLKIKREQHCACAQLFHRMQVSGWKKNSREHAMGAVLFFFLHSILQQV